MGKTRVDDFEKRRNHLKNLSNEELKSYFGNLHIKPSNP